MRLSLRPYLDGMPKVEDRIIKFMKPHGFSGDTIKAQTIIIQELIENARKYGDFTGSENRIAVSIHVSEDMITVEVLNPTNENAYGHLKRLDKTIQWIRGHQDPSEPYRERVKMVSEKPLECDTNGLGLARIAHQTKTILDFFVSEDNILHTTAVTPAYDKH